jgi:uncharacterized hydrophobic protein (TIGR00271 family)
MLHVRVASPAALTPRLAGLLAADPGVLNLVLLPGAVQPPPAPAGEPARPGGDLIQFDLPAAAANPVLARLRALDAGQLGPVTIDVVDAAIGEGDFYGARRRRSLREARATYHGETAPVWDLVDSKIAADSVYAPSFYMLLMLAALIGAVGILTNSTILIVGAMVVGPEYNAIIAVALGFERRDRTPIRRGLLALTAGFVLAIIATLLFSLVIRASGHVPEPYRLGILPVSNFIHSPDLFSVIVAVLAGLVGVVSLTEARAGALIGVFISVTTIPAAADIGLSVAFGRWGEAGGAVAQLLLNVVLLIVVGTLALRGQRVFWAARMRRARPAGSAPDAGQDSGQAISGPPG